MDDQANGPNSKFPRVVDDTVSLASTFSLSNIPKWSKFAKTAVLIFSWFSLGLFSEILGPSLPTLMHQTGANYEEIGFALSMRAAGMLGGSLIGSVVSDRWTWFRPYQMAVALAIAAVLNMAVPWITSLPLFVFILFVSGCAHGFLTTGGNPLIAAIWVADASGPFNALHAGYGFGAAATPALLSPFTLNTSQDEASVQMAMVAQNSSNPVLINPVVPYNLVAGILLFCACCFLPFHGPRILSKCRPRSKSIELSSYKASQISTAGDDGTNALEGAQSRSTLCYHNLFRKFHHFRRHVTRSTLLIAVCVFIIYFAVVGNERVFGKFMFTYAVYGPINMPVQTAYMLNLTYWIVFAMARVATCLLALCISARLLLVCIVLGTLVASIGLCLIPATVTWFFIFTVLFSMFKSPLFPLVLAVTNRSYEISGAIVLIVNFGSASGASLLQYAAGSLIEHHGQTVFPYIVCASACLVLVTATILLLLLRSIGDRFASKASGKFEKGGPMEVNNLNETSEPML